jgi:hypothetical protein
VRSASAGRPSPQYECQNERRGAVRDGQQPISASPLDVTEEEALGEVDRAMAQGGEQYAAVGVELEPGQQDGVFNGQQDECRQRQPI